MEQSQGPQLPAAPDSPPRNDELDRIAQLEHRIRDLEERIPATHLLDRRFVPRAFAVLGHYLAAGAIIYAAIFVVIGVPTMLFDSFGPDSGYSETGELPAGPQLSQVASLPVESTGTGSIQGAPTGATGPSSFVLALGPAPPGVEEWTRVEVFVDDSTVTYRDGKKQDSPIEALSGDGDMEADPSAAGSVVVRFHIEDGEVRADQLDLSDELPPGYLPD